MQRHIPIPDIAPPVALALEPKVAFTVETEVYVFELRTDWYNSLNDILAELDFATDEEPGDNDDPLGGYFSKN